jgi:hypothetical protein
MNTQEQLRHTFEELRKGTFLASSVSGRVRILPLDPAEMTHPDPSRRTVRSSDFGSGPSTQGKPRLRVALITTQEKGNDETKQPSSTGD